ncbi:hypothetical protein AOLI_G00186290 [Acnodon oligacanthus]
MQARAAELAQAPQTRWSLERARTHRLPTFERGQKSRRCTRRNAVRSFTSRKRDGRPGRPGRPRRPRRPNTAELPRRAKFPRALGGTKAELPMRMRPPERLFSAPRTENAVKRGPGSAGDPIRRSSTDLQRRRPVQRSPRFSGSCGSLSPPRRARRAQPISSAGRRARTGGAA